MVTNVDPSVSDLDIIEASYRLVADAGAFDDVIASWTTRIDQVDDHQIANLEHPLVVHHLASVTKLFDQVEPIRDDQFDRVVTSTVAPAAVLGRDGKVVAANAAARKCWSMKIDEFADVGWIDPLSIESFNSVRRSAEHHSNHRHAILRTMANSITSRLVECFVVGPPGSRSGFVAVRALDLNWSDQVATTLKDSFGLTDAELEICRLLLDTRETAQIAQVRGTSILTVRTQLRTIFEKTETATQVDLIRMIALLCTNFRASEIGRAGWVDPYGHEEIFRDADGRKIAFSWTGDPEGRPALLVHGMVTGYALMEEGVDELHRQGIKLYTITRPSFGNSDPGGLDDPIRHAASAIVSLARHLRIESWPAIGHGAGFPPLVRACLNPAARISSILGVAAYLPYRRSENFQSFPPARKIAFRLARNSQLMADLVGRFCYRMAVARKARFVEEYMYSDCAPDREALRNPECADLVASAGRFMIAHQHRAVAGDLRIMAADWSRDLNQCPMPIRLLHGEDDPVNRIAEVRAMAAKHSGISLQAFPDCGELLCCNHSPDIVISLANIAHGK